MMPSLYIIGGANGSGKTTVALTVLPRFLQVFEYVNADAIAAGLSPLNPESMAMQSGRLMVERLQALSEAGVDFAFETTLAARTFFRFIEDCKTRGYRINLIYLWLPSADLAVERVARRVFSGGHHIPEEVVRRRYERGLKNLVELYLPMADGWMIFDNSGESFRLVAKRLKDDSLTIYNPMVWEKIYGGRE
jgi:predicted ABC-type ATPase